MAEKMTKLGALWIKPNARGGERWTGNVEIDGKKTRIVIFPNNYKEKENQPDLIIFLDTYEPGQNGTGGGQRPAVQPNSNPRALAKKLEEIREKHEAAEGPEDSETEGNPNDDGIPF
jgi:hypothetical protein